MVLEQTLERSNQSILKETSPECSLEGRMLKLNLQYFGQIEGGAQRMRWLDGITDSDVNWKKLGDGEGQGSLVCCSPRGHSRTQLSDWTTEHKEKQHTLQSGSMQGAPYTRAWEPQACHACPPGGP